MTATTDAKVADTDNNPASADDEGGKTQPNDEYGTRFVTSAFDLSLVCPTPCQTVRFLP